MKPWKSRLWSAAAALVLLSGAMQAGPLHFDKAEYAARRQKLMEKIPDGAAVLLGATPPTGFLEFVQNNDFMYFSGVEMPNAILIIDGVRKRARSSSPSARAAARNEGISLDLVRNAEGRHGDRTGPAARPVHPGAGPAGRTRA